MCRLVPVSPMTILTGLTLVNWELGTDPGASFNFGFTIANGSSDVYVPQSGIYHISCGLSAQANIAEAALFRLLVRVGDSDRIATGARAACPDIEGLAEAGFLTNETVFNLTGRPRRLAVIGGGPIGCELAQAFRRLGSEVLLLHRHAHLLEREDADAAAIVQQAAHAPRPRRHGRRSCDRQQRTRRRGGAPGRKSPASRCRNSTA